MNGTKNKFSLIIAKVTIECQISDEIGKNQCFLAILLLIDLVKHK